MISKFKSWVVDSLSHSIQPLGIVFGHSILFYYIKL